MEIFRIMITHLAVIIMSISLTSDARTGFSPADISCDVQLKESVIKLGYPIEVILSIQNHSDIQVSIGQLFSTWGPDTFLIKTKSGWEDVQKRFYDQFFIESVPMENVNIPPGQTITINTYLTEKYKHFSIGKTELSLDVSVYLVMPELGYDFPMSKISCHTDALIEISECDLQKQSDDLESLMQQILTDSRVISFLLFSDRFPV